MRYLSGVFSLGTTELTGVGDDIDKGVDKLLNPPKPTPPPTIGQVTPAPPAIGDSVTKPASGQGTPVGQRRSQRAAARLGTSQFVIPRPQGINSPR